MSKFIDNAVISLPGYRYNCHGILSASKNSGIHHGGYRYKFAIYNSFPTREA
jgi:hypothetical protein